MRFENTIFFWFACEIFRCLNKTSLFFQNCIPRVQRNFGQEIFTKRTTISHFFPIIEIGKTGNWTKDIRQDCRSGILPDQRKSIGEKLSWYQGKIGEISTEVRHNVIVMLFKKNFFGSSGHFQRLPLKWTRGENFQIAAARFLIYWTLTRK